MTATVTGGGPAAGGTVVGGTVVGGTVVGGTVVGGTVTGRRPARRGLAFPRASSTPGKVRLIRMGLVIACLGWGALAALMVAQRASAAGDATSVSEPLSLDAQQMYQSLADADVTASAGYLYGRIQPFPGRQRYEHDTATAAGSITAARQDARSWFAVNQQAQKLDKALDYGAETRLVIGSGPGTAGTLFSRLEADLDAAIRIGQATFADSAAAGSGAFTGLEAGIVVLVLIMAAGSARGLSRRLAEYR
jgi:hypothetical protein